MVPTKSTSGSGGARRLDHRVRAVAESLKGLARTVPEQRRQCRLRQEVAAVQTIPQACEELKLTESLASRTMTGSIFITRNEIN